ncbi:Protein ASPARTIC PROTEASE IN GUARD CELL 1 [Linum grandiflorum]
MVCSRFKSVLFLLLLLTLLSASFIVVVNGRVAGVDLNSNLSSLAGIQFNHHMNFNAGSASTSAGSDCGMKNPTRSNPLTLAGSEKSSSTVKLNLNHRRPHKDGYFESATRDSARIQTLHRRITEKKNSAPISTPPLPPTAAAAAAGQLMATLGSGVTSGSGEYFMDVFIGTPPKHFSLILDTGSDLNWIQCVPCNDCFEQNGPIYDPKQSSSYKNITCDDPRCQLVSSPDESPPPCKSEKNQSCPYYYWYGDSSNTTGDFATETFTVNLTSPSSGKSEFTQVENVMIGCGHWNRGLFHGAAGLLGLGRGPLSFASQLQNLYGHSFSYCLVDRNSESNVTSKLIFGEDKTLMSRPELNFTSLVDSKENPNLVDTFYYVSIKSVVVGGETLDIPDETWNVSSDGSGGTIVDSGTTLSYFAEPAYKIIREAFVNRVKDKYRAMDDVPVLDPCYNVSGVKNLDLPEFKIVFTDGAEWDFPVENYFIWLQPGEVVCLAILGTPRSALSIIGNYQQQNFHILYDTKKSRIGYAPTKCADV